MIRKQFIGVLILLVIILMLAQVVFAAKDESQFHIFYNDDRLIFDNVQPVLLDGVTLVPFRKVLKPLVLK